MMLPCCPGQIFAQTDPAISPLKIKLIMESIEGGLISPLISSKHYFGFISNTEASPFHLAEKKILYEKEKQIFSQSKLTGNGSRAG